MLSHLILTAAVSLVGGDTLDSAAQLKSTSIGYLPRGLTSFGAVAEGGWLYVLGGYFGQPHDYSIEGQSAAFLRVNLLDPRDVRLFEDVEPVQGSELVAFGDKLIRVGGLHARNTHDEETRLESSSEVAIFDVQNAVWSRLPDLPMPRSSHRAVVVGDTLHVVGGWSLSGGAKDATWATKHLTLDLGSAGAEWESHDAPFVARALGAACHGNGIAVIGGITKDRSITTDAWRFDVESGEWSQVADFPDWGFGVSATASDGVTLCSGRSGVVYRLSADAGSWSPAGDLLHGRIFHEIVSEGSGSLLALGGIVGMDTQGRVRDIERLALGDDATLIQRVTVPAPCAVKNRFGFFLKARSVYLFGGNNSLGQHDFEPENFVSDAWRLDLGNLEWTPLDSIPTGRQTMQCSLDGEGQRGFAVGGFGHNGEDAVTQSESLVYEFEFDDWTQGPGLLGSRSQFGLARRRRSLWIFGGLDYDPSRPEGEQFDHRLDVLSWDGKSESFDDSGVVLPQPRRAFAGALLGDKYYLVGGMREGFSLVEGTDVFDFETQTWGGAPAPSRQRLGADLVPIDGRLYLVGGSSPKEGERGLESNGSIECLDPATGAWTTIVEDLEMNMKHARAFEVDGRLCILTLHRKGAPRLELVYVDVQNAVARRAD